MVQTMPSEEKKPGEFQAAILKVDAVTFVVVVVQKHILDRKIVAGKIRDKLKTMFRGLPILLVAQDSDGIANYYGRKDLVQYMRKRKLDDVPWKLYTITNPEK